MTTNKWISETKTHAKNTNKSFKESLQDKNHQVSYHAGKCDPTKMTQSGTLNRQVMSPTMPDHSYRTPEQLNTFQGSVKKNQVNYFFNGNGRRIFIHKK